MQSENPYYQTQNNPYPALNDDKTYNYYDTKIQKQPTPIQLFERIPKNTLDQSVGDTLCKQFAGMFYKFGYVIIPRTTNSQSYQKLKNWDLWGPFFMALVFGLFIDNGTQLSFLFFSIFGGALIVTFNIKVLGGQVSFLQSVSILGYCIFPIFLASMILQLMKFLQFKSNPIKLALIIVACLWCILSAQVFVSINIPRDRKFVAMFPLVMFYVFLSALLMYM